MTPLRVMAVFGTRPDTIKMAPVVAALRAASPAIAPLVCVSAQHRQMLDALLAFFEIVPDFDLDIMQEGQSLTQITTRVLEGMEGVLERAHPDVVLVHGDTTTSTAAALASYYKKIPVGHVEAGLRTSTHWEPYPEELNRRLTGRIADYHFAPTEQARKNLLAENVADSDIIVTGNTVVDAFLAASRKPAHYAELDSLDAARPLIFMTAHRRENHEAMTGICEAVAQIVGLPSRPQVLWPVHPSPMVEPIVRARLGDVPGVRLVAPIDYPDLVQAVRRCRFVLTDSGGLQEEAPILGKPVLVMRNETERPEGIRAGTLELVGAEPKAILAGARRLLEDDEHYARMARAHNPYGDGHAAERIVQWLLARLRGASAPKPFVFSDAA
ncbi:MAG TPA: UDP-N-acetylglucosamine 2-epimerase (non-hydrolyzing) [Candidatus Acidoferrales bacterium]|nr:UDP-N-acetylglucosamine 2-epimerase (non-hydrolyzing) [Candidatus Acidoferrales bacterium]